MRLHISELHVVSCSLPVLLFISFQLLLLGRCFAEGTRGDLLEAKSLPEFPFLRSLMRTQARLALLRLTEPVRQSREGGLAPQATAGSLRLATPISFSSQLTPVGGATQDIGI